MKDKMFVDTYSPKSLHDIIGHKEHINQITKWLQSWKDGYPPLRGVMITGPPGIGKTITVHLIADSLGYKVNEYNDSWKGISFGGLIKEIIMIDEVDGVTERGGIGEIVSMIKKSCTPIVCIANEKLPKLKPILNVCLEIKFNRPMKSTIATYLLKVAKIEKIKITKGELEKLCEHNGNDIRAILNILEFYRDAFDSKEKDSIVKLDLFSSTQQLIGNKMSLDKAEELVFVDYTMIPLMIQEAYIASSKTIEDACLASEFISMGDVMDTMIHRTQDWSMLPQFVQNTVSASKVVSGPEPFHLFPSWLGKHSKQMKHERYIDELSTKMHCSNKNFRLEYAGLLQTIVFTPLKVDKPNIKAIIQTMDQIQITRDDMMNLSEMMFTTFELSTKTKSAFTREYNKSHPV
jgi:replication factor C subunit 1